jgi:hypothetical protein
MVKYFRGHFDDFVFTLSGLALCFVAIIIFIGCVASLLYGVSKASVTTIDTTEWTCTESVNVQSNYNLLVGKVVVPQTKIIDECIAYKKISNGSPK